ncbi:MAG: hypothetical protein GX564_07130 [Oligosphaeraceae bacterium]|nr:hypothetical protein [Oligosphaeraceae bacterium]
MPIRKPDVFTLLPPGSVTLKGVLGQSIDRSIAGRLTKVSYEHLVEPFRSRSENDGLWRCEFWGKIVRSAIRSWHARPNPELRDLITATVRDLLSTQTPDGCISTYPREAQTSRWDVWGRKYVLLALCRYCHEIDNDPAVRQAIARCLRHLASQVGPGAKSMLDSGEHLGMAPSSILGAVLKAYRLTGEAWMLDYASWIIEQGGSPVFAQVRSGMSPRNIANGKAYEMTSCVEGLLEWYRETGEPSLLAAVQEYFRKVREEEIFVTGVGGLKDTVGEYWYHGAVNQVRADCGGLGETCVTTTYIRFCLNLLRATGDIRLAEEIERSLYNGALGAMTPDGSAWSHLNPTPLAGPSSRTLAGDQIALCSRGRSQFQEDCCLAQGPEALASAALFAALRCEGGMVINLYEDCRVQADAGLALVIRSGYPDHGAVVISIDCAAEREFRLKLRIPDWSGDTQVRVAGQKIPVQAGTYCDLCRKWQPGETIELQFAMQTAEIMVGQGFRALRRGPVLLARDSRLGDVNRPYEAAGEAMPVEPVPGFRRVYALQDGSRVCDYASAGNTFSEESQLRVFLP